MSHKKEYIIRKSTGKDMLKKIRIKKNMKRMGALLLSGALFLEGGLLPFTGEAFAPITAYADSWQGLVKATSLNVRSGPGTSYSAVDTLGNNTSVTVISQTTGTDGQVWYQISYGNGKTGYARHDFIKEPVVHSASDANFEAWMNQQGFPESYKNDLRGLHQQYPNWVFTAQKTGLDWNTVINEESKVGRNLVYKTSKSSWKSIETGAFDWANNSWPGFDGASWQAASREIISYYMDPRNFLSEPYIYQFELQSYNPSTQTKEGLQKIVEGTFLAGDAIVPVEGSRIEGGTIVEVQVGSSLTGSTGSSSGSSTGSSTQGPGVSGGSGSSAVTQGPGGSTSDNTFVNSGPGASMDSQSAGSDGVVIAAPTASLELSWLENGLAAIGSSLADSLLSGISGLFGSITAYAGQWRQDTSGWWYQNDNGSYMTGWNWIDGNGDGTAECYYFYDNGYMAANTEVDGYKLDADGRWVSHEGVVYTKTVSGGGGQTVQMKKVPYVDIIMKAAEVSNVSPYVLASMIIQEQGVNGTSDLISGTSSSYPGYYNFFNIGAYAHDGMGAVEAGLKYASESGNGDRPWNSIEKSIIGGAQAYGANYVNSGQDTFYLKKFNVQGTNLYNHQYMTNVPAAANEGAKVSEAYSAAVKALPLEFKIPVYENMPQNPCPMPTVDGNPNNKLKSITVDGFTMTPTFNMDVQSYDLIVDSSVASVNITAQTIDDGASVTGTGTVNLNTGLNTLKLTVTAENGSVREYTLNINRRAGGELGTGTQTGPGDGSSSGPVPGSSSGGPSGSSGPVPGGTGSGTDSTTGPSGDNVIVIG